MKKFIAFILIAVLCLSCLASCGVSYTKNEFFSEEFLTQNNLADMPVPPHLDASVYGSNSLLGNILYLNLTDEEYEQYVEDLLNYLRAKEDIYYLGYSVGSGLWGEMLPYDEIAPITDSYNTKADEHHIFFATKDGLSNSDFLYSPVEFVIVRESGKLKFDKYEYNTHIGICGGNRAQARWNQCGAEHTYDEGIEYIIPGSEGSITKYTCVYCGSTKLSDHIGDANIYNVTVDDTNADHYIVDRPQLGVSGLVYDVKVLKTEGAEYRFTVNGTEIEPRESPDGRLLYGFVMPSSDVALRLEIVENIAPAE